MQEIKVLRASKGTRLIEIKLSREKDSSGEPKSPCHQPIV